MLQSSKELGWLVRKEVTEDELGRDVVDVLRTAEFQTPVIG